MAKDALPIRGIRGNLIFTPNDAWACYYVRSRSYSAEPLKRRMGLARELMGYARMVEADFQILRISRSFDPDRYVQRLLDATPAGAHRDLWYPYLIEHRTLLAALNAWTSAVFVCVRLAEPTRDLQGRASRLFDQTPREVLGGLLAQTKGKLPPHVRDLTERARTAEARIRTALDARAARFEEVQWLIRRALCRGAEEPPESPEEACGIPHEEPERTVRRWLLEHGIQHRYRYLEFAGEHEESWQAGLCLGEMGHAAPFTRKVELMFTALEEYPWPIDASLNVRFIPNDQALRRVQHQVARTKHQLADEEQSDIGARGEGRRRVDLSEEFHDRLSATGEPILEGTLSFMLAADSHEELERRVRAMKEGYPWPLYRPYGDQLALWKQHLPGQPSLVRGYERPFTIEQIGMMVPHATHEAGSESDRALYIGKTLRGGQPVFLDLREASLTNKAPTIVLLGTLGGGKTLTLQDLLYQAFLQGARIVDCDPKNDHRWHLLPEVRDFVNEIVLGPDPIHRGKLDPLRVAPENERQTAAVTFLTDVMGTNDDKLRAAIYGAIGRVIARDGERACCMEVREELLAGSSTVEQEAGEMLGHYSGGGIVALGFASKDDPLPQQSSEQVTRLDIRALDAPTVQTVRSEMGLGELHGRAVMQLVALYSMKILGTEKTRMKVLGFDETSFIRTVGKRLLDQLSRWARSELAVPILSSQLPGDVADQDNLIGHWLIFAMQSRAQASQALEAIGLDGNGFLVDHLTQWGESEKGGMGRCVYRDLRGRTEEMQIDPGGPEWIEALSTTPDDDRFVQDGPIQDARDEPLRGEVVSEDPESIANLVKTWR